MELEGERAQWAIKTLKKFIYIRTFSSQDKFNAIFSIFTISKNSKHKGQLHALLYWSL